MNWNQLTEVSELDNLLELSKKQKVAILKHSTRCSISSMALNRLERAWQDDNGIAPYYLDLIRYRDVSNAIASKFGVEHQSPQVIVLENGKVTYTGSHMGISYADIVA
ncbi:bacillithiol system redox-active protein YtxJ [Flammeovirga kamogawensis]|uniref:Bacillithiol system redox-active protein YtxJ n=1 Tax=Flammeovirga kamogawensis TaxID=373891 RepID=A0ABX8GS54_9BACT|nr:bacillithiol system redox-active protein YtxJ [Flammeovirga kamogawensis]MBB6461447.1 bacillithiol system protein YtxJ [Flammeovirga kamogawensis]QWG06341.1 bacillithiol system redox-active protein YtxJ [Flammeovirga kamogawensis]TRX68169.1 bacillithiol system redox-active protein YtxJ [Flammeovirga kamogawensis]